MNFQGKKTIKILFFSVLADLVGCEEMQCSFALPISVGEIMKHLQMEFPNLKKWEGNILYAVDWTYVKEDYYINNTVELAIMPPVQGG
jgi:molybdopterin converting factor small subunit